MLIALLLAVCATAERRPAAAQGVAGRGDDVLSHPASRLTAEQINIVRYMELRAGRERQVPPYVERVMVRIPPEIVEEVIAMRQGEPDFRGPEAPRWFLRLTPPQKLAWIAYWTYNTERELDYARRIEIRTDPEVMVEFKRRIMPPLIAGCGSTACHGSLDVRRTRLRLYNDSRRSDATTYANFLALREWKVDGLALINSHKPEESLLLTYALPDTESRTPHPGQVRPMFFSRRQNGYQHILRWLSSLRRFDAGRGYGFRLFPAGEDDAPFEEPPPDDSGVEPPPGPP